MLKKTKIDLERLNINGVQSLKPTLNPLNNWARWSEASKHILSFDTLVWKTNNVHYLDWMSQSSKQRINFKPQLKQPFSQAFLNFI